MAKISLSRMEMETHIAWDAEQKIATVYTCDPISIRRLDKLVRECPEAYRCIWQEENPTAKKYIVPARFVRFGKPVSEAVRAANKRNGIKSAFCAQTNGEIASA